MRRQHDGPAGSAERLDRLADDERRLRVEGRGRLVEEHDRRVVQQRTGDGELLLHALAEGRRYVVASIPQREEPQVVLDALGAHGRIEAVEAAEEVEVGDGGELVVEARRLGQDPDPRPDILGRSRTSNPSTVAVPSVGRMSAVSIRTVVVLPAPFGPSRPTTSPRLDRQGHAANGPAIVERATEAVGGQREIGSPGVAWSTRRSVAYQAGEDVGLLAICQAR